MNRNLKSQSKDDYYMSRQHKHNFYLTHANRRRCKIYNFARTTIHSFIINLLFVSSQSYVHVVTGMYHDNHPLADSLNFCSQTASGLMISVHKLWIHNRSTSI